MSTANASEMASPELIDEFKAWQAKQQQTAPVPEQTPVQEQPQEVDPALIDEFKAWQAKQQPPHLRYQNSPRTH